MIRSRRFWAVLMIVLLVIGLRAGWMRSIPPRPGLAADPQVLLRHLHERGLIVVLELRLQWLTSAARYGYLGAADVGLLASGDVALAVDLRGVELPDADAGAPRMRLSLPQPIVHRARVDLEQSHLLPVRRTGLWAWTPAYPPLDQRLIAQVQRDAQQHLARAAADPAVIDSARRSAERQLEDLAVRLGWQVEAQWR